VPPLRKDCSSTVPIIHTKKKNEKEKSGLKSTPSPKGVIKKKTVYVYFFYLSPHTYKKICEVLKQKTKNGNERYDQFIKDLEKVGNNSAKGGKEKKKMKQLKKRKKKRMTKKYVKKKKKKEHYYKEKINERKKKKRIRKEKNCLKF
ncbi:hypothetical protein RFI_40388, partial [Reticulomyxa filosa]